MGSGDEEIDWYVVKVAGNRNALGAIGFINDQVVTITSFYDDRDANKDGDVSIPERVAFFVSPFRLTGINVVEVAMAARFDMEVNERDPEFYSMAMNLWMNFAKGLVKDGMYAAWFGTSVNMGCGIVAKELATGLVKQWVIKKGMETVVKKALRKSLGID
jgi:hypothetical protein